MKRGTQIRFITGVWIVLASVIQHASSFVTNQPPTHAARISRKTTLGSVENWISGLTNSPPSKPLLSKEQQDSLTLGTSLQGKELVCVYKASQDGWSAINFHNKVDGKGSALVVALSRTGRLFGGFNPLGWRSTDDYYQSNAAFLWFVENANKSPTKCPILIGGTSRLTEYANGLHRFPHRLIPFVDESCTVLACR
jgi:hypothetical protein